MTSARNIGTVKNDFSKKYQYSKNEFSKKRQYERVCRKSPASADITIGSVCRNGPVHAAYRFKTRIKVESLGGRRDCVLHGM
jgi:hypothetical protein